MIGTETRHIDLHLPQGWNQATTDDLEAIAAAIVAVQQRTGRYHPFSWDEVRLLAVLAINDIEIVSQPPPVVQDYSHDDTYMVRRSKNEEPWPITTGHLHALCEQMAWITDEKAAPLQIFPYPTLCYNIKDGVWTDEEPDSSISEHTDVITYAGPPPMMDGYTWRDYRVLQDWMQLYMQRTNAGRDASEAQAQFLALLFKRKEPAEPVAVARQQTERADKKTAAALADIAADPVLPFRSFPAVRWQVVLFWWSALMKLLQREYPRVFKQQPVGKGRKRQEGPWSFYNKITATIQKYIGLNERDVNQGTYSVTLQHMENMAREAEEMERISRKNKGKH